MIGRCIRDRVSEGSEYWGAKCQHKGLIPRGDEIRLFPKDCQGVYNLGSVWKQFDSVDTLHCSTMALGCQMSI